MCLCSPEGYGMENTTETQGNNSSLFVQFNNNKRENLLMRREHSDLKNSTDSNA